MAQERFAPELKYEVALRLAALNLHQHAMANGLVSGNKVIFRDTLYNKKMDVLLRLG